MPTRTTNSETGSALAKTSSEVAQILLFRSAPPSQSHLLDFCRYLQKNRPCMNREAIFEERKRNTDIQQPGTNSTNRQPCTSSQQPPNFCHVQRRTMTKPQLPSFRIR